MEAGNLDFDGDIRSEVLKYLPHDPDNQTLTADLEASDTSILLIRYLNWRERLIHGHRRDVFVSRELLANPIYAARRADIDRLLEVIRNGDDLTPYLSTRVRFGYLPRDPIKPTKDNPSLDLLLNEWGMHHLHISHDLDENGFMRRVDDILIALFRDEAAYVVDVARHGEWSKQRLVEIAYRNWPNEGFFVPLSGVVGLEREHTSDQRARLRGAGLASLVMVDGAALMSRTGGLSTAGTSSKATMDAFRIMRVLSAYEDDPGKLVSAFVQAPDYADVVWPLVAEFRFRLLVTPNRFCAAIVEMQTGKAIGVE
jgi:hypothetical protein